MCSVDVAYADRYTSADKALEEGLFSLKESAQQILHKNIILKNENNIIAEKTRNTYEELEFLKSKEQEVLIQTQNDQRQSNFEEKVEGKKKTVDELEKDLAILKDTAIKLSKAFQERQEFQDSLIKDIEQAQKSINKHMKDIDQLSRALKKKKTSPRLSRLQDIKSKKEGNISDLKKELVRVQKNYSYPLGILENLQKDNGFLNQELVTLKTDYQAAIEEAKALADATESIKKAHLENVGTITDNIALLNKQKQDTVKVLLAADERLGSKKVDVARVQKSAQFLKENLEVIRKENEDLKGEYSKLSNALDVFKDR